MMVTTFLNVFYLRQDFMVRRPGIELLPLLAYFRPALRKDDIVSPALALQPKGASYGGLLIPEGKALFPISRTNRNASFQQPVFSACIRTHSIFQRSG
ncbi:hypothetical protein PoB_006967400 [Plakobranchus ocellatus]|uniref:Uncharacterized protein n=1 Tax=Plakobranchus ocellatus TaxID=259542 RepID=A0AAV4DGM2_9GAST|nr:hypothetical protein PoB_006967400 [Plakobranchus ocellatus]